MEDYINKVKGTELEEEERHNEQDSCGVPHGYLPWVGTHMVCCALRGNRWGIFGYLLIFSSKPIGSHARVGKFHKVIKRPLSATLTVNTSVINPRSPRVFGQGKKLFYVKYYSRAIEHNCYTSSVYMVTKNINCLPTKMFTRHLWKWWQWHRIYLGVGHGDVTITYNWLMVALRVALEAFQKSQRFGFSWSGTEVRACVLWKSSPWVRLLHNCSFEEALAALCGFQTTFPFHMTA